MEGQRIYRHCPESGNVPCYNSICEHQCFIEEEECRKPEHDKPESEKTWEEIMKKFDSTPKYFCNSTSQPVTIHIHNDFGPLLESFLSIHQKLEKIMSTQTEFAAQVQAISTQVAKIGEESKITLQKVIDLEAALANQDNVSPELQAAVDELKQQVQVVDDLVADAPTV